jgi:hypothetical protein
MRSFRIPCWVPVKLINDRPTLCPALNPWERKWKWKRKDFKGAYDTITRKEVYVSMPEFSFSTKLIRGIFTSNKIFHLQDLDPSGLPVWQWDMGVEQKGGAPISGDWEEGHWTICGPKKDNGVYRKRINFELEREFDSPCVINIVKTNRLRYAGHMIRRPEDLSQMDIF